MFLTISTTHKPATDLGFLLHKNPGRCHSFDLSFGKAHVFYPEASVDLCTAGLLLEVDPVGMVRGRHQFRAGILDQYVNDRPYAVSSFMSVAISQVFGSALHGKSKERPELVATPIPLTARISVLPCRAGEEFLGKIFGPLGYAMKVTRHPLDDKFPEWGGSSYFTLELTKNTTLSELLQLHDISTRKWGFNPDQTAHPSV